VRRGTAIALLALAFLLGVVVGGLCVELLHLRRMAAWHHGADGPPELDFLVRRLERRLDLSREQTRQVEAIVEHARDDLWELRREVAPRIHGRMEEARAEIEQLLTPEQREELRRLGPPLLPDGHHGFGHGPAEKRRSSAAPRSP
jgi:Spy/CpxP family protein refolding chaperone